MKDNVFLDTNILVYLYSSTETEKRNISISILERYRCITSILALNEFCNVFIKKYNVPNDKIKDYIANISKSCHIKFINEQNVYKALEINTRYGYSYYDCLMLASALESGCGVILTEDMSGGQIIENKLEIVNPFKNQNQGDT